MSTLIPFNCAKFHDNVQPYYYRLVKGSTVKKQFMAVYCFLCLILSVMDTHFIQRTKLPCYVMFKCNSKIMIIIINLCTSGHIHLPCKPAMHVHHLMSIIIRFCQHIPGSLCVHSRTLSANTGYYAAILMNRFLK